ncbi:MAG: DNA polymerase III subunit delta [Bacteroidales bacterium]|nr:DNA polymerase III subunit delta [Bacteroidales bacterium]
MAKQTVDTTAQFNALMSDVKAGNLAPFYLLFGKEHYFIDALCAAIMEKALPPEERDFGQVVYYGADVSANQVVSAARQFPMMVSRQVVVVKEAQMMRKIEDIAVYFEAMMPTTVLVICYKTPNDPTKTSKSIDKRTAFYKQACKAGVVFESNQIADYKMARWIEDYFSSRGLRISPDASSLLAEYVGVDIQKVVLEVDKLLKVMPEGRIEVSAADIEENVGMSRDYTAFELTKALSLKDVQKCYRITAFFAQSEKRFPLPMTMAALSSHFIKLLRFHALLQAGVERSDILSQLGINPYFAREYDIALRNYPMRRTMKIISILREYDYKSKSNARGNASDGELLTELISKILA